MQQVLIVEDDEDIRELLSFNLDKEGFKVLACGDGKKAVIMAREHVPDIIVLDIMLPGMDGFDVCKELARFPSTKGIPIIMLTARGEEVDRIVGFELGAVDYVVKPFSVREMVLRIKAVLKLSSREEGEEAMELGGLKIEFPFHSVTYKGERLDLTATEYKLLEYLFLNQGRVLTREQLLGAVWGYEFDGYARTVDTHIRRLRSKLGEAAMLIETVRGFGYRMKGKE